VETARFRYHAFGRIAGIKQDDMRNSLSDNQLIYLFVLMLLCYPFISFCSKDGDYCFPLYIVLLFELANGQYFRELTGPGFFELVTPIASVLGICLLIYQFIRYPVRKLFIHTGTIIGLLLIIYPVILFRCTASFTEQFHNGWLNFIPEGIFYSCYILYWVLITGHLRKKQSV
jgi:hypothetical protein